MKIPSNFILHSRQEIANNEQLIPFAVIFLCRIQIYGLLPPATPIAKKNKHKLNISAI